MKIDRSGLDKTQLEVAEDTLKKLKAEDRKRDAISFLTEINDCRTLEQLKELADWYLSKPKVGR